MVTIIVAIIGFCGTAITVLVSNSKNRQKFELTQEFQNQRLIEEINDFKDEVKSLQKGLEEVSQQLEELKEESRESDAVIRRATMNSAKDRINQAHRYFTTLGKIDDTSLQSILAVWESYKECGGNSFIDREIKEITELPLVSTLILNNN
jgi:HAMP domain-containing protein